MSNVMGPDNAPNRDQRFISMVDCYQDSLLRMCCLYLCDKSLAEDAVQETFLKVYKALDDFRNESTEKTWIMKIAMHVCYDMNHTGWFRYMNRHLTPEMFINQVAVSPIDAHDEELMCAVMSLPRKLREVILLYYYQGMNVNEIADVLSISHSSVSGRLIRGREKLKHMLEGREFDE